MARKGSETIWRCGCGYEGSLFQVTGHQGRRRKNPTRFPDCQAKPVRVGKPDEAEATSAAEPESPWGPSGPLQEARQPEPAAVFDGDPFGGGLGEDETAPLEPELAANGNGRNGHPADPPRPSADRVVASAVGAMLYKQTVQVSPVLHTLHDMLRRDEGLSDRFEVWLEKSTLGFWRDRGYEVAVVVRSPAGEMAEVG